MASLPDQRSSAGEFPRTVIGRMRAAMGLLSQHPEDLSAAPCQNLPFLLDGRCVDPVLCIADLLAAGLRRSEDAFATRGSFAKHPLLRKGVAAEAGCAVSVVAGQRLFDDDVLAE